MGVYENRIKVSKIVLKCAIRNTLFNRKKMVKKGIAGMRNNTTLADCVVHKGHIKKIRKEKWAFLMNLETFMSATAIGK